MKISDVRKLIIGTANRTKLLILEELYKQGLLEGEDYKKLDDLKFDLDYSYVILRKGEIDTGETMNNLRFLKAGKGKKSHDI